MKYNTPLSNKNKEYYNHSLIDAVQKYATDVGYILNYNEFRKDNYKYETEDVIAQMGTNVYISLDKDIEFLSSIINEKYDYISSLGCSFLYVWPRMEVNHHSNGNIQVKDIYGLELLI